MKLPTKFVKPLAIVMILVGILALVPIGINIHGNILALLLILAGVLFLIDV